MNHGGSECSSGCESGWTLYLEKSSWLSPNCSVSLEDEDGGDGEEDMSMVSDASSGPPHFIDSTGFNHACFYPGTDTGALSGAGGSALGRRKDAKRQMMMLDDTACSRPVSRHLKKGEFGHRNRSQSLMESSHSMVDFSHGFSTTHLQDGPSGMDLYGHQYHQNQYLGGNWMGFK
uniref:Uncharacterized protein n=1 Tax=Kalanchoe fedtschenkoi TaxID=63787 RepID=A0A7N0T159_KALFE